MRPRVPRASVLFFVRGKPGRRELPSTRTPATAIGAQAIGAQAIKAQSIGGLAIGALAVGAAAIGALALGRLIIGRLTIRRARLGVVEIEELRVGRRNAFQPRRPERQVSAHYDLEPGTPQGNIRST